MKCNYPIWSPICPYHYNGECFREHNYECPALAMKNLSNGEMVQIAEGKKNKPPRYIDANKLIDLATHEGAYGYVDVHDIYNVPTADVVKVVRCKDCSFAEEIDFGLWVCHNADIQIVGDYVDEDWFCANGTTDLGEWDWSEDPRCADFVCSECLQRNITCEERCPHCGIKMRREEKTDVI